MSDEEGGREGATMRRPSRISSREIVPPWSLSNIMKTSRSVRPFWVIFSSTWPECQPEISHLPYRGTSPDP